MAITSPSLPEDCIIANVVLDVGRKVTNVDVGDAVWSALPIAAHNGALCEFVVVESNQLCLRPTKLSHDGAATLPYSCLKVWDALVNQGNIKPFYGLRDKHKSGKCMQARPLFMGKGHDGSDLVPLLLDNKSSTCNLGTSKQQEAK